MATISGTSTGNGQAGATWSATVNIDTSTGESTATVTYNTPTGSITLTGTPESISTQLATKIDKYAAYPPYVELLTLAQKGLLEQSATLTEQYKQLVPDAKTPADTAAPAAPPADAPAATAALNTSDPKIASTGTADSDKTGDSPPQKAAQDSITANNVSLGNAYSTQPVNIETNAPPSSAGTSTPGKAGSSPVTTQDGTGLLGRRLHNPLGDFSSYTYNIGLYLMDPNDYNAFIEGDHSVIKNFHLIVQSGGITNGTDSPRAKGFDLDFYIDNLEITTLTSGKETGDDTNSINCSFQVIEPYGFTFPSKLINAVKASINDKAATAGTNKMDVNETLSSLQNHFMLMIKFYGYDVNGKLISGTNYPQSDVKRSDDQSVFERAFPILIKHFSFKLDNKTMVYNLQAVLVSEQISKGVKRGKIQTGFSVKGETVKDVLTGTTSSNPNVVGLIQRLNDQQNEFLTRTPNP